MIYNIRGPSGAGKSWVVRRLLDYFGVQEEVYAPDQRTVEGYWLNTLMPCFLVGSYSAPTGGADSLHGGWDQIADILLRRCNEGDIILEGIRINSGHTNLINLVRDNKLAVEVIFLNTNEEDCYQNVLRRRDIVRNKRAIDQVRHWIVDHIKRNERQVNHFQEASIPFKKMSSEEAASYLIGKLS